jgi:MraZ protein
MTSFYGTETHAIDPKGRISIPASMRRLPTRQKPIDRFLLISGFDGCLSLYTEEAWGRVEERLMRQLLTREGRQVTRTMLMDATRVTVDAQGRITIPPALVGRAELGKEAVLLGQIDRIEIWKPEKLQSVLDQAPPFERGAEQLLRGN